MDVSIVKTHICEASFAESWCSIRRLHYQAGILVSLSFCHLLSFPLSPSLSFFLSPPLSRAPLAIQHRGALRNWKRQSRKRIEKLKRERRRGVEKREEEGGVEGRSRGWSEVLRREQTRQGTVAHGEMEGLGIKEEDGGENEQISMVMKREIRGMTGCKGENYGQDENGIWASWERAKRKCGQELKKGLGRDTDAQCMHGVC